MEPTAEVPTAAQLRKLRVVDLRKELQSHQLSPSGNKEDLISRLRQYYVDQQEKTDSSVVEMEEGAVQEMATAESEGGGVEERGEGETEDKAPTEHQETGDQDQEPAVMKEPPVIQEPPVVEEPAAMEEAAAMEEPSVMKEPSIMEEPSVMEEPAAIEEPSVMKEPSAVEEPAAMEEPAVVGEEVREMGGVEGEGVMVPSTEGQPLIDTQAKEEVAPEDHVVAQQSISGPGQSQDRPVHVPDVPTAPTSDYYSDSAREEMMQTVSDDPLIVQDSWPPSVPVPVTRNVPNTSNQRQAPPQPTTKDQPKGKKKKKRRRRRHHQGAESGGREEEEPSQAAVEIEYVQEDLLKPGDVHYRHFHKIFEAFKLSDESKAPPTATPISTLSDESPMSIAAQSAAAQKKQREEESDEEEEPKEPAKLSKKKLRKLNRLSVAQLKQLVDRPDVVEMHDVTAQDPKLLIHMKSTRNTVPVPRHWCFKRKYLQGKRGIEKPPFNLPDFIKATGIMEMRQALEEKEDAKSLKQKTRERVRPKMGKLTIDYQKLHDAFFRWQTKPKMTIHGDLYYEGKEFETRLREKKPGDLSDELRRSLGMPTGLGKQKFPPPWLVAMQRYGPPPSYPNLKIPGLNAPIPEGCSFGYFVGGWGKPPVDEVGRPLYGDVFGVEQQDNAPKIHDEDIDKQLWGELESEEEQEEEEESEEEEGEMKPEDIQAGLITPVEGGLVTPSGLTSIPAGLETPEMIQLRKKKIEEAMEQGGDTPALYTVLPEKSHAVGGAVMGSSHVYDLSAAVPGATKKVGGGSAAEGVEVALDPSELDLDAATMTARYEEQLKETKLQKEDLSDMVAEHAAKQKKRKRAATDSSSGKASKKLREFKF